MLALYMAARTPRSARHAVCVQLLLRAGASLHACDVKGNRAIEWAPAEWRDALNATHLDYTEEGRLGAGEDALLRALGRRDADAMTYLHALPPLPRDGPGVCGGLAKACCRCL